MKVVEKKVNQMNAIPYSTQKVNAAFSSTVTISETAQEAATIDEDLLCYLLCLW
jgi:hypothetical protein